MKRAEINKMSNKIIIIIMKKPQREIIKNTNILHITFFCSFSFLSLSVYVKNALREH